MYLYIPIKIYLVVFLFSFRPRSGNEPHILQALSPSVSKHIRSLPQPTIFVVSPFKLMGYLFQFAGFGVMIVAFLTLVLGIQNTVGSVMSQMQTSANIGTSAAQNISCDPQTDEFCGVDINQEGAITQIYNDKVYTFILYLGAGIVLMVIGLILRATEEIGGFFAGLKEGKQRVRVGKWKEPPKGLFWP
jgi:hypothetical protein